MTSPSDHHIQTLIAHYLRENNLYKTLQSLELEVNRKFNYDSLDESLTSIVNDRIDFVKLKSQKSEIGESIETKLYTPLQLQLINSKKIQIPGWTVLQDAKKDQLQLGNLKSLIIDSSFAQMKLSDKLFNLSFFVSNDKNFFIHDIDAKRNILHLSNPLNNVAAKIVIGIPNTDIILCCGMNGLLTVFRLKLSDDSEFEFRKVSHIQLHQRLITSMKYIQLDESSGYLCSIGWDFKLVVQRIEFNDTNFIIEKVDDYKLMTNGSCLEILLDEESGFPLIFVGRLETSMISVFTVTPKRLIEVFRIALNDSEFSSHSFQAMNVLNSGNQLVSFATNHIPFMRIITIYIPKLSEVIEAKYDQIDSSLPLTDKLEKLASNHKNEQLFQSHIPILRDIIVSNLITMSPQDKFSSPIVLNRGIETKEGIWVFGDDGIIRGLDLSTGEIVETLEGHDGRIKTAFVTRNCEGQEVMVTCGAVDRLVNRWED